MVYLFHDGVEATLAFDGVPIGISNRLREGRCFCLCCLSMVRLDCPRNHGQYKLPCSLSFLPFLSILT